MKPGLAVLGACAGLLAIGLVLASDAALPAGQYEAPPSFSASQVLRPELLSSPNYRIGDRVGLENFQYAPRSRRVARGGGHRGAAPSEIWITGKASELATSRLAERGWKVVPKAAASLGQ
jgi:hypothetical protein